MLSPLSVSFDGSFTLFQPRFPIPSNFNLPPNRLFQLLFLQNLVLIVEDLTKVLTCSLVLGEFAIPRLKHAIQLRCGIQSTITATKEVTYF